MATTTELAALRASFRQEVAVWNKLDHPNVTSVRIDIFVYLSKGYNTFFLMVLIIIKCDVVCRGFNGDFKSQDS